MPTYVVTAYCEKCAVNHPTAVELDWSEQVSPQKNIAEVFEGMFLPPEIAMMSRNYFLCPQTGKMHKQADNTKMFLAKTCCGHPGCQGRHPYLLCLGSTTHSERGHSDES